MAVTRRDLLTGAAAAALGGVAATVVGGRTVNGARSQAVIDTAASTSMVPATSRNSVFTRSGPGPLYWTAYGWSYPNNAPLPESVWQQNIDWMASTLAPYGYTMACTDGWTLNNQNTNANGYVISYNPSWTHDWAYWARYLASKGMKLGVYYDPLWVCASAVNDPTKRVVGRPDIPISAIVSPGDLFNHDSRRYWVDVTKDGAKEYIQGYVNYFKNAGAAYLRMDFLSWYEAGWEQNMGSVGVAHGSQNYATALRWISDAAGDDIELSLVMPNLYHHAANELLYGDLVRIDDDMGSGGWQWLSGGRQTAQPGWSQWHNPFLGFTGFSDRSGRGQLILDGDFLAMNSFANDDERRTALNLFTMAGSPIAVADRVDTIGGDAAFYQNTELLDLRKQGLVGKPYYYNANPYESDRSSRDSERWMGQLPDGTWVVGLFNRGDSPARKSLDFTRDLGINGPAGVRDIWAHAELGTLAGIATTLNPHASQVVTVRPREAVRRYQAEFAGRSGDARFNNNQPGYSATGFVEGLDGVGAKVVFAVSAPGAGSYTIRYRYANTSGATSTMTAVTEDVHRNIITGPTPVSFRSLGSSTAWGTEVGKVTLQQGTNLLTLVRTATDSGAIKLDCIELDA